MVKGQIDISFPCFDIDQGWLWFSSVADALQTAVVGGEHTPAAGAGDVDLTVFRIDARAHDAAGKFKREHLGGRLGLLGIVIDKYHHRPGNPAAGVE